MKIVTDKLFNNIIKNTPISNLMRGCSHHVNYYTNDMNSYGPKVNYIRSELRISISYDINTILNNKLDTDETSNR